MCAYPLTCVCILTYMCFFGSRPGVGHCRAVVLCYFVVLCCLHWWLEVTPLVTYARCAIRNYGAPGCCYALHRLSGKTQSGGATCLGNMSSCELSPKCMAWQCHRGALSHLLAHSHIIIVLWHCRAILYSGGQWYRTMCNITCDSVARCASAEPWPQLECHAQDAGKNQ